MNAEYKHALAADTVNPQVMSCSIITIIIITIKCNYMEVLKVLYN